MGIVEIDFKLLEDKIGNSFPSSTLSQAKKNGKAIFEAVGADLREF